MILPASLKREFSIMQGNLLVLTVSGMFLYFTISLTYSFESPYIRALGAPPYIIGLVGSAGAAALGLIRLPGAYIADKYGRKRIIAAMTFVVAFSYIFYVFAPDWRFVLIGIIIFNLSSVSQPALQALQADSISPERRGMGYVAAHVFGNVPTIFAPAIAGFLISTYGLTPGMRLVYSIVVACSLAAAIIRSSFLKETLREPKKTGFADMRTNVKGFFKDMVEPWKSTSKSLKFLAIAFFLYSFEYPVFRMFHSLYVLDVVKISPIEWAYANTLQKVAFLTLSFPLGSLIDRIKRKHVIILAHLLFIASTVLLLISRGYAQLLLAHLTFPLSTPLWNAYFVLKADMVQRDARGRVLGVTSTLANLASIPASGLAGFLYDFDPTYPFILTMILGVIAGAIVFLKVDEPKTRQV